MASRECASAPARCAAWGSWQRCDQRAHVHRLAGQIGQHLHAVPGDLESEIIYVHKVDSRHMLGMYSRVGRRAPLHNTAIGKVLMAREHPQQRELIMQGMDFKRYRNKTITNKKPTWQSSRAPRPRASARTAENSTSTSAASACRSSTD